MERSAGVLPEVDCCERIHRETLALLPEEAQEEEVHQASVYSVP